jgi:hypothetical protein
MRGLSPSVIRGTLNQSFISRSTWSP